MILKWTHINQSDEVDNHEEWKHLIFYAKNINFLFLIPLFLSKTNTSFLSSQLLSAILIVIPFNKCCYYLKWIEKNSAHFFSFHFAEIDFIKWKCCIISFSAAINLIIIFFSYKILHLRRVAHIFIIDGGPKSDWQIFLIVFLLMLCDIWRIVREKKKLVYFCKNIDCIVWLMRGKRECCDERKNTQYFFPSNDGKTNVAATRAVQCAHQKRERLFNSTFGRNAISSCEHVELKGCVCSPKRKEKIE